MWTIIRNFEIERLDDDRFLVRAIYDEDANGHAMTARIDYPASDNGGLPIDLRRNWDRYAVERKGIDAIREKGEWFVDEDAWTDY